MTQFEHLLTDEITVSKYLGRTPGDAFGTPLFGAKTKLRAAVSDAYLKVRDSSGSERVSSTQIVTAERIALEDRIWITSRAGSSTLGDDIADDDDGRTPVSIRYDSSRKSGKYLFMTFL